MKYVVIYLALLSYMVIFVTVSSYIIFNWQWGNLPFTCCVEIGFLCTRDRHVMRIIHCYWFEFYITADCSLSFGVRAVLSQCFCKKPNISHCHCFTFNACQWWDTLPLHQWHSDFFYSFWQQTGFKCRREKWIKMSCYEEQPNATFNSSAR